MGRYRSPATSRSKTMGWLEGISTRTPITSTSSTQSAYSEWNAVHRGRIMPRGTISAQRAQTALYQTRVQPNRQRRDLLARVLSTCLGARVATSLDGRHDLLDETNLAVRGDLYGPKVSRLKPKSGQLPRGLGDHERVAVVMRGAMTGTNQPECLQPVSYTHLTLPTIYSV